MTSKRSISRTTSNFQRSTEQKINENYVVYKLLSSTKGISPRGLYDDTIDDLHATSRRPCWWNLNKRISLTSFVCGTNMAAKPLSSESQGIGCKSSIYDKVFVHLQPTLPVFPKSSVLLRASMTRYTFRFSSDIFWVNCRKKKIEPQQKVFSRVRPIKSRPESIVPELINNSWWKHKTHMWKHIN